MYFPFHPHFCHRALSFRPDMRYTTYGYISFFGRNIMYCTRCGTLAKEGDYYCRKCGAVVDHDGLDQVSSFPPVPRSARSSASVKPYDGNPDLNWTSILGTILGVVSLLFCWSVILGFFSGVLGLIFCIVGRNSEKKKLSKAGIIINIIGAALSIGFGLYYLYFIRFFFDVSTPYIEEFGRQWQNML